MGIAALEAQRQDRPLVVLHVGAVFSMDHPRDLSYRQIADFLQTDGGTLAPRLPMWKASLLLDRWLEHHALGTRQDIGRLSYLIEHYEHQLTYDLRAFLSTDLPELWSARRWRYLLMLIDRLPRWSYYSEAVSNNEEHARQIAESQARLNASVGQTQYNPPMSTWTPEVAMLAEILDATRGVQHAVIAVQAERGKAPKPPERTPRPRTALQREMARAERERKQAVHEDLVAKFLPHKAKQG